ncbi:protein JTB [Pelodytes ibericus]
MTDSGGFIMSWPAESSLTQEQKISDGTATNSMCWLEEEFGISKECRSCNKIDTISIPQCRITGFVEEIQCSTSNKSDYKSCRSVSMEKQVFWRFVASMMAAAVALSLLVVFRQRTLDRRALEKVRKQIESI